MAKYKILYWHDIPSQVRATDENGRVGKQLPERFQEAIDEAAMKAGLTGDDKYTAGFQWSDEKEHAGTAEDVAEAIVADLNEKFHEIDWQATARKLKNK
jgi:hypothetical protein